MFLCAISCEPSERSDLFSAIIAWASQRPGVQQQAECLLFDLFFHSKNVLNTKALRHNDLLSAAVRLVSVKQIMKRDMTSVFHLTSSRAVFSPACQTSPFVIDAEFKRRVFFRTQSPPPLGGARPGGSALVPA